MLENGLVCLTAGGNALRLMTPLVITDKEIIEGINIIRSV